MFSCLQNKNAPELVYRFLHLDKTKIKTEEELFLKIIIPLLFKQKSQNSIVISVEIERWPISTVIFSFEVIWKYRTDYLNTITQWRDEHNFYFVRIWIFLINVFFFFSESWYPSMAKWLSSRNWLWNVYGNPISYIYWNDIFTSFWVSIRMKNNIIILRGLNSVSRRSLLSKLNIYYNISFFFSFIDYVLLN